MIVTLIDRMTPAEARAKTNQIKDNLTSISLLLLEMYERAGWEALGYSSWREYGQAEFGYSETRVYELLNAAKVERNVPAIAEMDGPVPEAALRPLTKLPAEQQPEAWQRAVEVAKGNRPTGTQVAGVVAEMKGPGAMAVHYSSEKDDWETPPAFFAQLDEEFGFTLDVCATADNAKCARYFSPEEDGLAQDWGNNVCWMNPPYGRVVIKRWMKKAFEAAKAGATAVCLIPARTDTSSWWWEYVIRGEVRFIRGRIKFVGGNSSAPFPSAVVVFRPFLPANGQAVIWWANAKGELDYDHEAE